MKKHLVIVGFALAAVVSPAMGQANTCPAGGSPTTISGAQANVVHDACLQAVDVFNFVAPQLGLALAGGNATLGQGGALGGIGHFTVGVRANAFNGDLPQVSQFPAPRNEQNPAPENLQSKKQVIGLPVADAAIGLFKGIPLGLTSVGGLDLLVNASYVPAIGKAGDDVQIKPQSSWKFGFGGRLGLVQESLLTPGVAVTYIVRDVPTTDILGTSPNVDLNIKDADIKTTAWRVVANKNFIVFGVAVGAGQDHYKESTTISGTVKNITVAGFSVGNQPIPNVTLAQDLTRTNVFADLSLNLPLFKIVGEVGQVTGGTVNTTNTFTSGKADDSRVYGSLGLRLGW